MSPSTRRSNIFRPPEFVRDKTRFPQLKSNDRAFVPQALAIIAQRTHFGTHKGHHCQEGVRIWPGDYARRRAGLTILLDPSAQVPGSSRRAARSQAGAPAAAQRRGRTSLTPASGGRSSGGGEGFGCGWACQGSCAGSRFVAGGVVSQAPIRRRASARLP